MKEEIDILDSKEFYELMYIYKHTFTLDQNAVVEDFEDVKDWLRKNKDKIKHDQI